MDVILIPGLWLDGSSWNEVAPTLEAAGHRVEAVTLPGMESRSADRSGIGLRDHVAAVVALIDRAEAPVVLAGHSGGGGIAQQAADARPEQVARVVYVDAFPAPAGSAVNDEIPADGSDLPFPGWEFFEPAELVGFDEQLKAEFVERAIPSPKAVACDRSELRDPRRLDVPATLICCAITAYQVREWIGQGVPFTSELAALRDVELVDLPTGHWPQFTRPTELGEAILRAVTRSQPGGSGR